MDFINSSKIYPFETMFSEDDSYNLEEASEDVFNTLEENGIYSLKDLMSSRNAQIAYHAHTHTISLKGQFWSPFTIFFKEDLKTLETEKLTKALASQFEVTVIGKSISNLNWNEEAEQIEERGIVFWVPTSSIPKIKLTSAFIQEMMELCS